MTKSAEGVKRALTLEDLLPAGCCHPKEPCEFCQCIIEGYQEGFLAGRESALKPLREHAEMLNREIVYGRMTDKNCYVDFCNLITMLLTTTKLKKV